MTPRQLEILQHSLGVNQYGETPKGFTPYTRNHFCAGESDEPTCRELVALGYMVQHATTQAYPYFNCSVTEAGKKAMRDESPKPPKLSRSKRRYLAWLDADCGMTFKEWITRKDCEVER
jgi:hypothetical protein